MCDLIGYLEDPDKETQSLGQPRVAVPRTLDSHWPSIEDCFKLA
jgi:hypothetical protein